MLLTLVVWNEVLDLAQIYRKIFTRISQITNIDKSLTKALLRQFKKKNNSVKKQNKTCYTLIKLKVNPIIADRRPNIFPI